MNADLHMQEMKVVSAISGNRQISTALIVNGLGRWCYECLIWNLDSSKVTGKWEFYDQKEAMENHLSFL